MFFKALFMIVGFSSNRKLIPGHKKEGFREMYATSEKYPFKLQIRFSVCDYLCAEYLTSLPDALPPYRCQWLEGEPGFKPSSSGL